jgi:hypothetical protein
MAVGSCIRRELRMNNYLNLPKDRLLQYVGSMDQLAGVRRFDLSDDKAKGVEAIHVETGSGFTFTILVDRALDMSVASYCGKSLCWRSSAGIVASSYYERRGSGWLRGFGGGMLVTCGLRNVGPRQGEGWETFGLHGEISFTPASHVHTLSRWLGSNFQIEASGLVREAPLARISACGAVGRHSWAPTGWNLRMQLPMRTSARRPTCSFTTGTLASYFSIQKAASG